MAKFNKGDLVKLKSGGPTMTVNNIHMATVYCAWFAGANEKSAGFSEEALVPAPPEEPKK